MPSPAFFAASQDTKETSYIEYRLKNRADELRAADKRELCISFDNAIKKIVGRGESSNELVTALNELKKAVVSYRGSRLLSSHDAWLIINETNKLIDVLASKNANAKTINDAVKKFQKNTLISSGSKCRIALNTIITTIIGAAIGFWFGFIAGAVIGGAIGAGYGLYASREDLAKCIVEAKFEPVVTAARLRVS